MSRAVISREDIDFGCGSVGSDSLDWIAKVE